MPLVCRWCYSGDIVKRGFRYNKTERYPVQLGFCKTCKANGYSGYTELVRRGGTIPQ